MPALAGQSIPDVCCAALTVAACCNDATGGGADPCGGRLFKEAHRRDRNDCGGREDDRHQGQFGDDTIAHYREDDLGCDHDDDRMQQVGRVAGVAELGEDGFRSAGAMEILGCGGEDEQEGGQAVAQDRWLIERDDRRKDGETGEARAKFG